MITTSSFVSETLNTIDAVIGDLVQTAYVRFIETNSITITLLFTLYVMFLGYQFIHHHHHFNMSNIMRHLIVMVCVFGLVMNWQLYHLFVYNIFTNEPGRIAEVIVKTADTNGTSVIAGLDHVYSTVIDASAAFFGQAGISVSGIVFIFYGILVFLIGTAMCIFALLLFVYAKIMMAVVLALGPIFILFILWNATRGLFSAWLNTLMTLALIPIVTSILLMLLLSLINITLSNMDVASENLQFYGIAPFLSLCLATALLLSQVLRICSGLGSGISLASLSAGAAIASSALQKSGAVWAGRSAVQWTKTRGRKITRRLF